MRNLIKRIKFRAKKFSDQFDDTQESIVFAQAGHHQSEASSKKPSATVSKKLLVVGNESQFSEKVVSYALDMAKRMSYEIVALNTAPLSCDSFKFFSTPQKDLCNQFERLSRKQAEKFQALAKAEGIQFTHLIKFSEPDQAQDAVYRTLPGIEFVISDENQLASSNRISDEARPENQVFVYSML